MSRAQLCRQPAPGPGAVLPSFPVRPNDGEWARALCPAPGRPAALPVHSVNNHCERGLCSLSLAGWYLFIVGQCLTVRNACVM